MLQLQNNTAYCSDTSNHVCIMIINTFRQTLDTSWSVPVCLKLRGLYDGWCYRVPGNTGSTWFTSSVPCQGLRAQSAGTATTTATSLKRCGQLSGDTCTLRTYTQLCKHKRCTQTQVPDKAAPVISPRFVPHSDRSKENYMPNLE